MIKKSRAFLFSLLGIAAVLFIFRETFFRIAVERTLYSLLGKDARYEKLSWENGGVHIWGLSADAENYHIGIDQLDAAFSFDLFPFYFETHLSIVHPEIILAKSESLKGNSLSLMGLFPTNRSCTKADIQNGVLQIEDQRLYFMFKSGEGKGKIGTLSFANDPGQSSLPFLFVELEEKEQKLFADVKVQQVECSQILHLASAFYPWINEGWEEMRGEIELSAKGEISFPLQCEKLDCEIDLRNLSLVNTELGIQAQADAFHGEMIYPSFAASEEESNALLPLWKQMIASLSIERGDIVLSEPLVQGEWGMQELNALVEVDPGEDPSLALQGLLLHRGNRYPLELGGKGTVHEDQTFWLEFNLRLDEKTEALFSLCSPENRSYVLQGDLKNVACAHLEMAQEWIPSPFPVAFSNGDLDGKFTIWVKSGKIESFQFDEVKGKNVQFACPAFESNGNIEEFAFTLKGSVKDWDAALSFSSEASHFISLIMPELGGAFKNAGQMALSALLKGNETNTEVSGTADFLQEGENLTFGFELKEDYQLSEGWFRSERISSAITAPLLKWVNQDLDLKGDLDLFGTFDLEKVHLSVQGTGICLCHPYAELQAEVIGEKDPMLLKTEGRGEFTYIHKDGKWTGMLPLVEARFEEKSTGLVFEHVNSLMTLDGNRISFKDVSAACEGIALKGDVDLVLGESPCLKIASQRIEGNADALRMIANHFPAFAHLQIPFQGELISGEQGLQLFSRFSKEGTTCTWNFSGGMKKGGFAINSNSHLQNVEFDFICNSDNNTIHVQNLRGQLAAKGGNTFQLKSKRLCFTSKGNWRGEYDVSLSDGKEEVLRVAGTVSEKTGQQWECALDSALTHFLGSKLHISRLVFGECSRIDLLEMQPTLKCRDLFYQLCFLSQTAFLAVDRSSLEFLRQMQLEGSLQTHLRYQGDVLEFRAEGKQIKMDGSPINNFRLSGEKIGSNWVIEKLQADDLCCTFAFAEEKESIRLSVFEMNKGSFQVKGEGIFHKKAGQFIANIRSAEYPIALKTLQGIAYAQGKVQIDLPVAGRPVQMKGNLEVSADLKGAMPLSVYNEGAIAFFYTPASGLKVKDLDLYAKNKDARLTMGELGYDIQNQIGTIKKLQFSLPPDIIERFIPNCNTQITGLVDLEFGKDSFLCQGSVADGSYCIGERSWDLKQVMFRWDDKKLNLACKTAYQSQPLLANLQLDYSTEVIGMLKLQENAQSPGVKILFKAPKAGPLDIHSIQGSLSGVEINFAKSSTARLEKANVLTGNVKIDAKLASPLFSKQIQEEIKSLKLGKGYELEGKLILWKEGPDPFHFSGSLTGQEFSILGCQFQNLDAQTEITPNDIFLQSITVSDQAGTLKIKQVKVNQDGEDWKLDIPLIQLHDLKPSLMKKLGAPEKPLKPLVIRNLSLFNISGIIGKASTFKGNGHFNFTNAFKKESNLFDVPLEMLKKLGLDLGILTPVNGEIDLQMIGDKFYLTEMKNMYSEGKRSEFYLAPEPSSSYVDWKGNLHLDFKMKQEVLLKITEPFILTVRGTLEKPRYGFE